MNNLFSAMLHKAAHDTKGAVHLAFWFIKLVQAGFLIGAAGVGFVAYWAFLTLGHAVGPSGAALLLGLVLMGCSAVGMGLLVRGSRPAKVVPPAPPTEQPDDEPATSPENLPALIAFTAAFVLARYMADRK